MRTTLRTISALALLATIGAPVLFLAGRVALDPMKWWMALGAVAWFLSAPGWMDKAGG
jgi:hypothetical protein